MFFFFLFVNEGKVGVKERIIINFRKDRLFLKGYVNDVYDEIRWFDY